MQAYLSYEDAQKIVAAQGLKSQAQWLAWSKTIRKTLFPRIPSTPHQVYGKEFFNSKGGLAGWLGTLLNASSPNVADVNPSVAVASLVTEGKLSLQASRSTQNGRVSEVAVQTVDCHPESFVTPKHHPSSSAGHPQAYARRAITSEALMPNTTHQVNWSNREVARRVSGAHKLRAMGFHPVVAHLALAQTGDDVDSAVHAIMSGSLENSSSFPSVADEEHLSKDISKVLKQRSRADKRKRSPCDKILESEFAEVADCNESSKATPTIHITSDCHESSNDADDSDSDDDNGSMATAISDDEWHETVTELQTEFPSELITQRKKWSTQKRKQRAARREKQKRTSLRARQVQPFKYKERTLRLHREIIRNDFNQRIRSVTKRNEEHIIQAGGELLSAIVNDKELAQYRDAAGICTSSKASLDAMIVDNYRDCIQANKTVHGNDEFAIYNVVIKAGTGDNLKQARALVAAADRLKVKRDTYTKYYKQHALEKSLKLQWVQKKAAKIKNIPLHIGKAVWDFHIAQARDTDTGGKRNRVTLRLSKGVIMSCRVKLQLYSDGELFQKLKAERPDICEWKVDGKPTKDEHGNIITPTRMMKLGITGMRLFKPFFIRKRKARLPPPPPPPPPGATTPSASAPEAATTPPPPPRGSHHPSASAPEAAATSASAPEAAHPSAASAPSSHLHCPPPPPRQPSPPPPPPPRQPPPSASAPEAVTSLSASAPEAAITPSASPPRRV
ncbi:hypothetical protein CYMTET_53595 [Cymbomonas tetramitiformis]|uniref:UBA domain-containing protein n=1 Tax=Cymbomonas tetramitiformis TaxID=36881 RepID=A0AAE0EQ72_9CHLO|nr:hypothetical protein CYMTET_53595 [Cymbomonas tetramitiformis]